MEVDKCANPINGLNLAGNHSNRRITKSVMEKKRRARINTSLTELKTMLAGMIADQTERVDKLEKADILELTVKYVKQLQRTSIKGEASIPDEKYRSGFNTCFNEVLKYISASDSCKPEMRAKVLSHLVDRFTNKNTANNFNNQSSHPVESSANQKGTCDSQSQFSFDDLPNRSPSSVKQSVEEPEYKEPFLPGDGSHTNLSVHIPNTPNSPKTNSPLFDQNNNVKPIQIDNYLNHHGKINGQTGLTPGNLADNVRLVESAGLVKIASQNAATTTPSPVQFITSGTVPLQSYSKQPASTQVHCAPATLQPNTMTPFNILQADEVRLPLSPVQLTGPTNVSESVSNSTIAAQNLVQYLNYSATPFTNPKDGQLTILVPANVITLPTLSPSRSVFLASSGSSNVSPVSSIQSSLHLLTDTTNEKVTVNEVNRIDNVNSTHVPKLSVPNSRNRCSPYDTAFRQTKSSDEKSVRYTETSTTWNEHRNDISDASPTLGTSFNTSYNEHYQKNVLLPIIEFQTDRVSSLDDLTNSQTTKIDMRSCFSKEHQTSNSASVWRPWNM